MHKDRFENVGFLEGFAKFAQFLLLSIDLFRFILLFQPLLDGGE